MPTAAKRPLTPLVRMSIAISTVIASAVVFAVTLAWWAGAAHETAAPPSEADAILDILPDARPRPADADIAVAGITGTVRDLEGEPLAGARVCAWRLTAPWSTAERATPQCVDAGPDGFYILTALPPLRHAIHASAPRHRPARLDDDLSLRPGERRGDVDFALAPGGARVAGVVQDVSGGVVEGAWVSNGDGQGPGTASARSDAAGRFTLWVSPGFVHLMGQADGYADATEYGSAPGEALVLRMTPESVLVGQVVMADTRAPVAGARVTVIGELGEAGAVGMGVTRTDAAGRFRLARLQPGVYKPRVQAQGRHGEAERSVHLGLGETSNSLTIALHPVPTLAGRIAVAGGGVCPRGHVYLVSRTGLQSLVEASDEAGEVRFPALRPDTYDVQVQCPGLVVPTIFPPVTVSDVPVTGVVWEVMTGRAIRGTVVDAHGQAAAGLSVSAYTEAPSPDPRLPTAGVDERIDAAGRFEISGLMPGAYRVQVHGESLRTTQEPVLVELTAGSDADNVQIRLPPSGELRGVVVDERGDPVGRLQVISRTDDSDGSFGAVTASDGNFMIGSVAPGEYRVYASRPGPVSATPGPATGEETTVRVVVDTVAEARLVVAAARGEIRGRVLEVGGGPITDAFVHAVQEQPGIDVRNELRWGGSGPPTLTDADGNFTIDDLFVGAHALRAYRRGGGEAMVEHVPTGTTTTLTITPTAELGGTLEGERPDEFAIYLVDERTMLQRSEEFYRTEGRWYFEALPAGTYDLFLESALGTAKRTVTLAPDEQRTDLRVALAPPGQIRGRAIDAATQAPVAGLKIVATPMAGRTRFSTPTEEVTTDADGRFEIPRVTAGPVLLGAHGGDPLQPGMSGDLQAVVESGRSVTVVLPVTPLAPPSEPNP